LLAPTAVVMNAWLGRVPLHGGAALIGGNAWAVLADRTGGKSTTLACLHREGISVLSDDVLAIDSNLQVYSGPRCVDLRAPAAKELSMGRELLGVGLRERYRVDLGEVDIEYPLAGLVYLHWSGRIEMARLPPREALTRIFEHLALTRDPDPSTMLALASLPAFMWSRPPSFIELDAALKALRGPLEG